MNSLIFSPSTDLIANKLHRSCASLIGFPKRVATQLILVKELTKADPLPNQK